MNQTEYSFLATAPLGMEQLLAQELKDLGATSVEEVGSSVKFKGRLEMGYRACLWSRIASRILLPLKVFPAADEDRLYAGVRAIHWTDHLTAENTLAVEFNCSHSKITHSHYGALKVKDAIVDQFRAVKGTRPSVDPAKPDVRINVYLVKNEATVSLDLSGDSLHRRGYRDPYAPAPLKENLAAALLAKAGWKAGYPGAFLDPLCGSGTLVVEAGLIAARIAPGLRRDYFGFLNWQGHVPVLWRRLLKEAEELMIREKKSIPKIVGFDQDVRSVRMALQSVERAGLHGKVHFEKRELAACERIAEKGILLTNPPYGERLGEVESLKPLYKLLGDTFKQKFKGWEGYIFTGSPELAKGIGLKASQRIPFFNGPIECRLLKYDLY